MSDKEQSLDLNDLNDAHLVVRRVEELCETFDKNREI